MTSEHAPPQAQRREVFFSGHVQGVGFRYTARHIAARFPVVGYVQNLPDGRVKLVAEGDAAALDRFLVRLGSEMERHIRSQQSTVLDATGEFTEFGIRH